MKKNYLLKLAATMLTGAMVISMSACSGSETKETTAAETAAETETEAEATADTEESSTAAAAEGEKTVYPQPDAEADVTVDGMYRVSFTPEDIKKDGDRLSIDLKAYELEYFDMVDMHELKAGDTIVIDGDPVKIDSIEFDNGYYIVNGDIEEGGYRFATDEDTVFYMVGMDGYHDYHEVDEGTVPVSDSCVIYDSSDLVNVDKELTVDQIMNDGDDNGYGFCPDNTSITVDNGEITEIHRTYLP